MKRIIPAAMLIASLLPAALAAQASPEKETAVPAYVKKAIDDPARESDKADDARRQAAAVMAFTGVEPGDKVLELVPGSGYWTRVFSGIVGSGGQVYTVWPDEVARYSAESLAEWQKLVETPDYANVTLLEQPAADLSAPEPVDLVFTSQNYHDYHDPFMGPVDMAAFNKKVFEALEPGGSYVVIDHVAAEGSGLEATDTLHRIDPAVVRKEVEAAGFVFDGASDALRNPEDTHEANVFDDSIRGHTDQFIYRFRKPSGED